MIGQCCMGVPASRRLAASILPGALLVFLPKCPLCIAAWLTAATGVGFSAGAAGWVRGMLVVFWVAAVALAASRRFSALPLRRQCPKR
jgi:F0F1-type ATP synthase assembly protein I